MCYLPIRRVFHEWVAAKAGEGCANSSTSWGALSWKSFFCYENTTDNTSGSLPGVGYQYDSKIKMNYFDYDIKAGGQVQVRWNATEQALWLVTNGTPHSRSWHSAVRSTCTRWTQKANPQLYFLLEIILYCCRKETTGQAKQRHFLSFLRPVMTMQSEHTHLKFPVK